MMLKIVFFHLLCALTVVAQNSTQAPVAGAMPIELDQDAAIKQELEQLEQSIDPPKKPLFELDFNHAQAVSDDRGDQVWAEMSVREQADFYWAQGRKSLAERVGKLASR